MARPIHGSFPETLRRQGFDLSRETIIYGISTIQTDNGVPVKDIAFFPSIPYDGTLHLLGLANIQTWHGYDRVIEGMARYKKAQGDTSVVFHIAGTGAALPELKELCEQLCIDDRAVFHGHLSGDRLNELQAMCHVGIASLGMHRIKVEKGNTSPLKSREYAAAGFPFVVGYLDHDFPADFPFQLVLPANEEPIDIAAIVKFYAHIAENHPGHRAELRKFAEQRLDWGHKFLPLFDYLKKEA
ncbi:MAG: glycosyltransferase family 4 protein [Bacteroidales bacterium]|nr:glycosyltransferase family 4 protein [Bacteroidales bacterium]